LLSEIDKAASAAAAAALNEQVQQLYALMKVAFSDQEMSAAISDETVQKLLTIGLRLYARKTEFEDRGFSPFLANDMVTATEVVTVIPEMLRAADLSAFDLALWLQRPKRQ